MKVKGANSYVYTVMNFDGVLVTEKLLGDFYAAQMYANTHI